MSLLSARTIRWWTMFGIARCHRSQTSPINPETVTPILARRLSPLARLRAVGGFRTLFIFAAYSVVFAGSAESGSDDTTQQVMNKATITSQTITVEHIRMQSER